MSENSLHAIGQHLRSAKADLSGTHCLVRILLVHLVEILLIGTHLVVILLVGAHLVRIYLTGILLLVHTAHPHSHTTTTKSTIHSSSVRHGHPLIKRRTHPSTKAASHAKSTSHTKRSQASDTTTSEASSAWHAQLSGCKECQHITAVCGIIGIGVAGCKCGLGSNDKLAVGSLCRLGNIVSKGERGREA